MLPGDVNVTAACFGFSLFDCDCRLVCGVAFKKEREKHFVHLFFFLLEVSELHCKYLYTT